LCALRQFVNFTEVMASTTGNVERREALFALRALMEIPEQYQVRH
jgi:E3 ubiquitin-protein ligase RGLG